MGLRFAIGKYCHSPVHLLPTLSRLSSWRKESQSKRTRTGISRHSKATESDMKANKTIIETNFLFVSFALIALVSVSSFVHPHRVATNLYRLLALLNISAAKQRSLEEKKVQETIGSLSWLLSFSAFPSTLL